MIKAAMVGAGNRGKDVYGAYAEGHRNEIIFAAVAEPDGVKRSEFAKRHKIAEDMCFSSWEEMLEKDRFCDCVFICNQDKDHFLPAMAAMDKGYDLLLEKPMSPSHAECHEIIERSKIKGVKVTVAHVLRYTPFFQKLKEILDSGIIGEITAINLNENVGYWHYAHSYVRGNWSNTKKSSPMILAKSCHDMDLLLWLTGKRPVKLSSFGSLKHFKEENAPEGSGKRCLDCRMEGSCPYSAVKLYLGENTKWPVSVISTDPSIEARIKAINEGPYGRCVYRCDNDVVDHQVVNIEFEDDIYASFTMSGFTHDMTRDIRVMGTLGELAGGLEENKIEIHVFSSGEKQCIHPGRFPGRHSGGDYGLMKHFVSMDKSSTIRGLTSAEVSLMSHIMAFAAEESRLSKGLTIEIEEFMK